MSSYTFTVTQTVQGFTATIAQAAELTLTDLPDTVNVTATNIIVTATSTVNQITVLGAGQGQSFNQSLNTTDDVEFNSVTTNNIYGTEPITFGAGISLANTGTAFVGSIDQGTIYQQYTNQLSLLFALVIFDLGTILLGSPISVDMGAI